jgi:predicted DsbA family dithiol-disulfide isomerase
MDKVRIQHFSDILCVWAYVSQIRVDELKQQFPGEVELDYHFVHVFGHAHQKIEAQWAQRGGMQAYGGHVREVVEGFGHVPLHADIWVRNAPRSSLPAHLFLSAVKLLQPGLGDVGGNTAFERAAWSIRKAFFRDLVDVSQHRELMQIGEKLELPLGQIEAKLDNGAAHALLSEDLALARELTVRASPTMLFNEGRQVLTGNVGYRVIEANVRELLRTPADQSSWC